MNDVAADGLRSGRDLDRVVMFSDGVFAIAMTLLAVSLRLPDNVTSAGIPHALRHELPSILTYFLSFAVVGIYWLADHRYFGKIQAIDSRFLVLNLVVLSLVAFLPFPTTVLGEYATTTAAVIFYAASVALLGTAVTVLWAYASHGRRLLRPDTSDVFIRYTFWRGALAASVFALSIPVALISARAGRVLLALHLGRPVRTGAHLRQDHEVATRHHVRTNTRAFIGVTSAVVG